MRLRPWAAAGVFALTIMCFGVAARADAPTSFSAALTSTTSSLPSVDQTAKLIGVGGSVLEAAARGNTQDVINALPKPPIGLAYAIGTMALTRLGRRSFQAGGSNLIFDLVFWGAVISLPFTYLGALFGEEAPRAFNIDSAVDLDTRVYLLTYNKSSPLTGSFARKPQGLGIGYDGAFKYSIPKWGLISGLEMTFQESEIDANNFVDLTTFFLKLDAKVGVDLASLVGHLAEIELIKRQRLSFRIGPSMFHNWIVVSQNSGLFSTEGRDPDLNEAIGLSTGVGYEMIAELDLDLGFIGGINIQAQKGSYPSLTFPQTVGQDAALLTVVGFSDLRGGDSYDWQRLIVTLDIPFVGFAADGSLNIGGQLSKLEAGTGASVNNRGLSIGGSWRW